MSSEPVQPCTNSVNVCSFVDIATVQRFLDGLQDLKSSGVLCDVVLKGAEDLSAGIPCHRVVLCAQSSYFRSMFTSEWKESSQEEIRLRNIPTDTLKKLVNYAYTLQISLDADSIQSVLTAALFLDISPVAKLCWDFLENHLDVSSCLQVYSLARMHNNPHLADKAKVFAFRHFSHIARSVDFLRLDAEKVTELIGSDELCVDNEDEVFEAVKSWSDYDPAGRSAQQSDILQYIRVSFLSPKRLENYFLALYNGLNNSRAGNSQDQSRTLDELPVRNPEAVISRSRPRESYGLPKVIVYVGGCDEDDAALDYVEVFSPSMSIIWRVETPTLPYGVDGCGVTVLKKNSLVVCGGNYESMYSGTKGVSRLDLFPGGCTTLAPMLVSRAYGGTAALHGRIYAVGGCNSERTVMAAVEFYDTEKNIWQSLADLPQPLLGFAMVATRNRLYVFGGMSQLRGHVSLNTAFCYNPTEDVWTKLADMPTARRYCSACVGSNGLIYVIGGISTDGRYSLRCVEVYDTSNDQWSNKCDMISGRSSAGCAYVDRKIYVLGGSYEPARCDTNTIEFFDEDADKWNLHPCRLSEPRIDFGCTVMTIEKGTDITAQMNSTEDN
ncbi:kelch-like protein 3 [Paramacrobiotus metropolitanus]|uniref:kelch-like protein 3 n=1 Tax=Paramacrobiotus metropolitanus TaxID=2943436 RepID=UPI002445DACF|nr:kelch-like protein 3 [Paramacrobiotus metropolitanus]